MSAPRPGGDRSRTLAPLLGALAVFAVVLVAVIAFHNVGTTSPVSSPGTALTGDNALACPATYSQARNDTRGWVPHGPRGLNGDDRLVPTETPTHATVCAYLGGADPAQSATVTLSNRVVLKGDLTGLASTLSALPRASASRNVACSTALTAADRHDYLLGLQYGSAILWVSAPGYRCAGSTNGSFTTSTNIAADVAASYAAKKWVTAA